MATNILYRRPVGLAATDFDIVAMNPVITDFEVVDAAARPLPGFQLNQELAGIGAQGSQFVQLCVIALANDAAIPNNHGWVFYNGVTQQCCRGGKQAGLLS